MGRITAYETSDGRLFKERKDYIEHARNLVAGARLQALIDDQVVPADVADQVKKFYQNNLSAIRSLVLSKDTSLDGTDQEEAAAGDTAEAADSAEQADPVAAASAAAEPDM